MELWGLRRWMSNIVKFWQTVLYATEKDLVKGRVIQWENFIVVLF
jgi:hypothetical protein